MNQKECKESVVQKRISALVTVLLILTVLFCLFVVIQVMSKGYVNIGGYMMFRVVTGSMEPTISVGALLVTKEVDIDTVQLNDIICFHTQEAEIWGKVVTHRVVGVLEGLDGSTLLETKGDANLVMDGYLVDRYNFVGKVVWYTGDDNVLTSIFSFFTNKVGFLGCIVFPCLLLAGFILKDCVCNIKRELQTVMDELDESETSEVDPLCGMTPEEYQEMYERIKAELIEELMHCAELQMGQQHHVDSDEKEESPE